MNGGLAHIEQMTLPRQREGFLPILGCLDIGTGEMESVYEAREDVMVGDALELETVDDGMKTTAVLPWSVEQKFKPSAKIVTDKQTLAANMVVEFWMVEMGLMRRHENVKVKPSKTNNLVTIRTS
ncbi:hypothetical protein PAAG_06729 [Paracoccidioides lutzii Pb01]|uniref:Uncharacterized protein n=1 Tax=Paracoccidioides lutzii (strain ATCC MYA-826 / Pb01) TaxID=502779 RepID=C1H7I8_PARBA|nr:hypothetical protein PAAG_06729 [Paracoccidioides lutzii Pb01]EEH36311.2 hypothetical protein PAAG_06729 [Paracoccidioides lutzii Pb01]